MNKCISCGVELAPQSSFCGVCGTMQPSEPGNNDPGFVQTVITPSSSENPPLATPPLPPQPQTPLPLPTPSSPHLSPAQYSNPQLPQLQQPHSSYQQPLPAPNSAQLSSAQYSNPQLPQLQQPHSSYQQPLLAPSSPQLPPAQYSNPQLQQQPYSGYQQPLLAPSSPQLPPAQYSNPQLPQQQQPYSGYQQPLLAPSSPQFPPAQYSNLQLAPNQAQWSGQQPVKRAGGIIPWIIVGTVIIVILGAAGIWTIIPRPPSLKPTITVKSKYHDDAGNPAGAKDTRIHIDGQQFANNSKITFLLDNNTVISDKQTESDDKGNLTTDLLITPNWSIGNHTLTAYDESKNTIITGKSLTICDQGNYGTPGPNNAPPNNTTFSFAVISDDLPNNFKLNITGSSSSKGGSVCSNYDNDTTWTWTAKDGSYTQTSVYSCHGTYKGGQIVYSQTLEKRFFTDSNNNKICGMNSPHADYRQLNGQFTQKGIFEGNVIITSLDSSEFDCNIKENNANGTWVSSQINTTNA